MGWWSKTVLGGDTPLDILCEVEGVLDTQDLYPLEHLIEADIKRDNLKNKIESMGLDEIITKCQKGWSCLSSGDDEIILYQVVASVILATGANLSDAEKEKLAEYSKRDYWASEDEERKFMIDSLVNAINTYENKPLFEVTEGLFEQIFKHQSGVEHKREPAPWKTVEEILVQRANENQVH